MPAVPYVTITNNISALTSSANSEPVVGIFHDQAAQHFPDPIAFVFDAGSQQWIAATLTIPAQLGVFAMARAPNGDLWFGAKWGRVYRSTDNGRSYTAINETALVAASAPCYYPAIGGNPSDGAIYSINVDRRGWVYAGTEGAGVIYSSDNGTTWQPVDAFACDPNNPTQHNLASPMEPITHTGNTGAIGFTRDNNVVWNGTGPYNYANWFSSIGYADVVAHTAGPVNGFVPYFIVGGLQTQKIVTTASGTMFLHSGTNNSFDPNPPPPPATNLYSKGLYSSNDGQNWTQANNGITSGNNGGAEGSLAVDGDRVFMATVNGKVWYLDTNDGIFSDGFDN
ncbi:MAG: sialidase family protein [Dokdonella sp.]